MASLVDIYTFHCRRHKCKPNTQFTQYLNTVNKEVKRFDFSKNLIGSKGLLAVLDTCRNARLLEWVDFSENWLEHSDATLIIAMAAQHPSLTRLSLCRNPLHMETGKTLLALLAANPNLVQIDLDGTEIVRPLIDRINEAADRNRQQSEEGKLQRLVHLPAAPPKTEISYAELLVMQGESTNIVCGEWDATTTSGGSYGFTSWRRNPQFFLWPSQPVLATVTLFQFPPSRPADEQIPDTPSDASARSVYAGLIVMEGIGLCRIVDLAKTKIISESPFTTDAHVQGFVSLERRSKALGDDPYVIMPSTFRPNTSARFGLMVQKRGNAPSIAALPDPDFLLEPIPTSTDYHHQTLSGEWTDGTSGGSIQHPSWRDNSQYRLSFQRRSALASTSALARTAKVTIVLSKSLDEDCNDRKLIGVYIFTSERENRKRLLVTASDIIVEPTMERKASVIFHTNLLLTPETDYLLMPCTSAPGETGPFTLSVFSDEQFTLAPTNPAAEWFHYTVSGEWMEPLIGGGPGVSPKGYLNNPSCAFMVVERTQMLIVLQAFPTAVSSSDDNQSKPFSGVGILVTANDAELSRIAMSTTPRVTDTTLLVENVVPRPGGYILTPHTFFCGESCRFIVRMYASNPLHCDGEEGLNMKFSLADRHRLREMEVNLTKNIQQKQSPFVVKYTSPSVLLSQHELQKASLHCEEIATEVRSSGRLFMDRAFPPGMSSVWDVANGVCPYVVHQWKRISELYKDAVDTGKPVIDPKTTLGIVEGPVPNAWLLGSLALVATRPSLLRSLFLDARPDLGFYQIALFPFGQPRILLLDDHVPVDTAFGPAFGHSLSPNDCWAQLLEKGYAKLRGSYHALSTGTELQGLADLTGGTCFEMPITDSIRRNPSKEFAAAGTLWRRLQQCVELYHDQWLVGCVSEAARHRVVQGTSCMGILYDHMYGVVDVREYQGLQLVQIFVPWMATTWNGSLSAPISEWNESVRNALCGPPPHASDVDQHGSPKLNTVWMTLEEFSHVFDRLVFCRLPTTTDGEGGGTFKADLNSGWMLREFGEWAIESAAPSSKVDRELDFFVEYKFHLSGTLSTNSKRQDPLLVALDYVDFPDDAPEIAIEIFEHEGPIQTHIMRPISPLLSQLPESAYPQSEAGASVSPIIARAAGHVRLEFVPSRVGQFSIRCWLGSKNHEPVPSNQSPFPANSFALTVVSLEANLQGQLTRVENVHEAVIDGKWSGSTSGGSPLTSAQWRNNPQFLLRASPAAFRTFASIPISLTLKAEPLVGKSETPFQGIGLLVMKGSGLRRILFHAPELEVCHAESVFLSQQRTSDATKVECHFDVEKGHVQTGLPYVIIPYCMEVGQAARFTIIARGQCHGLALEKVDPRTDWIQNEVAGEWSLTAGTAGGSTEYQSWFENPQFSLRFPDPSISMVAFLHPLDFVKETEVECTVARILPKDGPQRKRLCLKDDEIVTRGRGTANPFVIECQLKSNEPHGFVVTPTTVLPDKPSRFRLSVFTSGPATLLPIPADGWHQAQVESEWKLGFTAGGPRTTSFTSLGPSIWSQNPKFRLSLLPNATAKAKPSKQSSASIIDEHPAVTVTLRLRQHPRPAFFGADAFATGPPTAATLRQQRKMERFALNAERVANVPIAMDICMDADQLGSVFSSPYSTESDLYFTLPSVAVSASTYVVVPHTVEAQQDARFTLTAFANVPVQLTAMDD